MSRRVRFQNGRGMDLVGILAEQDQPAPGVVLTHSFTGYKEIPHLHAAAEALYDAGFTVLRFDFSDCIGESDGRCEDITLTNQVDDLDHAITYLRDQDGCDGTIGLAGHSLGGMTAIIVAQDAEITALAPIAAPAYEDLSHLVDGDAGMQEWEQQGHHVFDSYRRGDVRVGWRFVEDMREYDAREAIAAADCPVRIIHGTDDDMVPFSHAEELFSSAHHPKQLQVLSGAGHLFREDDAQTEVVELVRDWMQRHLA